MCMWNKGSMALVFKNIVSGHFSNKMAQIYFFMMELSTCRGCFHLSYLITHFSSITQLQKSISAQDLSTALELSRQLKAVLCQKSKFLVFTILEETTLISNNDCKLNKIPLHGHTMIYLRII